MVDMWVIGGGHVGCIGFEGGIVWLPDIKENVFILMGGVYRIDIV